MNSQPEAPRKRSSRACDGCKTKRLRCEDIKEDADGLLSCKLCREFAEVCHFAPVKKRGPAPGFRKRQNESLSHDDERSTSRPRIDSAATASLHGPSLITEARGTGAANDDHGVSESMPDSRTASPPPGPGGAASGWRLRSRLPLLGLPREMVDELLAVYFTHVHNVWPLIYKPLFSSHTASPPLLLAMLCTAACVSPLSPSAQKNGLDEEKLFHLAESSLHHCRMESRIDIAQAMILLSLRQTGNGDKGSAFMYAARACGMCLNLGLHLASVGLSSSDSETRSRVYWNAYVLDKSLAEETGRPFLLAYRRSSTPLPSLSEVDELETWPPLPMSTAPLPQSVRHVAPRRGHIISCFTWTCRLAMIVEGILDLDIVGPPATEDRGGGDFDTQSSLSPDSNGRPEALAEQLRVWRKSLPKHLEVQTGGAASPLPHHIVGLAWYATACILLYSRYIPRRRASALSPASGIGSTSGLSSQAHLMCSNSAQTTVQMLQRLDKHKLLGQVSSDIIHILSLTTLFEAFDSTNPDPSIARQAKSDFHQCCVWLRDFSKSWPAASAHKVFFEAVIEGGMKLSSPSQSSQLSPSHADNSIHSPTLPDGLQAVRRNLSMHETEPSMVPQLEPRAAGASSLMQLPQYFWNQLSNPAAAQTSTWDPMPDFMSSDYGLPGNNNETETAGVAANLGMNNSWNDWSPLMNVDMMQPSQAALQAPPSTAVDLGNGAGLSYGDSGFDWTSLAYQSSSANNLAASGTIPRSGQDAITNALLSYMMGAAKGS